MNRALLIPLAALALALSAAAQTPRIDDLTSRIRALDAKIEAQIDTLAATLEKVKDSPESKGRVAKVKKDFMEDLKKSIDLYRRERDVRIDKIGRPTVSATAEGVAAQQAAAIDDRIDKRVDQIVAISQSFTESDGYRDYVTVWHDDPSLTGMVRYETDESIQKRREGDRAAFTESKVEEGIARSIADLESRKVVLQRRLDAIPAGPDRAALEAEIARIDAKIAERRTQAGAMKASGEEPPATTELSSKEAFQLDKDIDAAVASLRADFRELLRLANEREVELQRLR